MVVSASDPDLSRPLRRSLTRMQWATGLDATMAGAVTAGGRRLVVTELHGLLTTTMSGLVAAPGMGIGGKVLQQGRPAAVNDYLHSTAVSHHFDHKVVLENIHGALAVPVRVGREVRAVLYGLARTADPLGDRVLQAATAVAAAVGRELAVEIEVARRLRAIDDERRRREQRTVDPELRDVREELCSIAHLTADPVLRARLLVLGERVAPPPPTSGVPLLSERERQVLEAVAVGRTNLEVAEELSIMPTTVKTYLRNAMRKLGTRNRVQTVHAARCAGLIGSGRVVTWAP